MGCCCSEIGEDYDTEPPESLFPELPVAMCGLFFYFLPNNYYFFNLFYLIQEKIFMYIDDIYTFASCLLVSKKWKYDFLKKIFIYKII